MSDEIREIDLTKEEREALQGEGNRLDRLLTASSRSARSFVEPPVTGSPMERANSSMRRESFDMAYALIFGAEDHFRSMLLVLQHGPLPGFSLYSLLRPAMEADLHARHLLEPEIPDRLRLARALNLRLDNLVEQLRADHRDPPAAQDFFDKAVARLEQRATNNGITVLRKRKPPHAIYAFEEPLPTGLDLFKAHIPRGAGETVFRFLSGHIHSKFWVWAQKHRSQPSKQPGVALISTDLNVMVFTSMLKMAIDVHDTNLERWLKLAGYNKDVWELAKQVPA